MNTHSSRTLALSLALASAGCAGPIPAGSIPDAAMPTATIPTATCAAGVLSRFDEPTGLTAGPATVLRLHVAADGRASLSLEIDAVATTLSLPAAPIVAPGDLLMVELDPAGAMILRSDGDLVAYVGPRQLAFASGPAASTPVDRAAMLEANRDGTPLSIDVAGVPLTLEAACGGWVGHHGSTYGCPNVPMAAFSVRHGDTTVAPGGLAVAPLEDGSALAIENRGVHVRETTEHECADLWQPSFGLTLVVTAAE